MKVSINPAITSNITTMKNVIIASLIKYSDSFICSLTLVLLLNIPFIIFSSVLNNIIAPANANMLEGISNIPCGKTPYIIASVGHIRKIVKKLCAFSCDNINDGMKNSRPPNNTVKSCIKLCAVKAINDSIVASLPVSVTDSVFSFA